MIESEIKTKHRVDEEKKGIINRIHRMIGQLSGIEKMVINDRYCDDILIQLSALDKSIKSLANLMLDAHLHTCVVNEIKNGNEKIMDDIVDLVTRFQ